MSKVSVENFINALATINSEGKSYKVGHDGSTQYCDEVGLIRGALLRSGATKIKDMKESNQCARFTLENVRHIDEDELAVGTVLLKTRSIDDSFMPLPTKYRKNGAWYNYDENNYTDIGVITSMKPFEVMHMTKKGIKKDKKLKDWEYMGWLPYVMEERRVVSMKQEIINSNGAIAKIYAKPSFGCHEYFEIFDGCTVEVIENGDTWSFVSYGDHEGYILSRFLMEVKEEKEEPIDLEELEKAYELIGSFLNKMKGTKKKKFKFFSR